jgi:hypothetical protein
VRWGTRRREAETRLGRVSGGAARSSSEHDDRCRAGAPAADRRPGGAARRPRRARGGRGGGARQHAAGGLRGARLRAAGARAGRALAARLAAAGASAVLLIPMVLYLGGGSLVSLGVASMAFSAVALPDADHRAAGAEAGARRCWPGCGIGFATWLFLVCRGETCRRGRAGWAGARAWRRWSARRPWRAGTSCCRPRRPLARGARARRRARRAGVAGRARVDPAGVPLVRHGGHCGARMDDLPAA